MKSIVCIRYLYLIGSLLLFGNSTILAQSLNSTRFEGDENLVIYKCKMSRSSKILKIPISSLTVKADLVEEGQYNYSDSFDVLNDNQLVVAGIKIETGNFLKFVDLESNKLLAMVALQADPAKMKTKDGKTSMMSIDENYQLTIKEIAI